jgi:integrase/recombinase XerD
MTDAISPYKHVQQKHLSAPLLSARDRYLAHLKSLGAGQRELRTTDAYLRHIVRIMNLDSTRSTTADEIHCAAKVWASYNGPYRQVTRWKGSPLYFTKYATQWFRFLNQLTGTAQSVFDDLLDRFAKDMVNIRGLSPKTAEGYRQRASYFLKWLTAERHGKLAAVCLKDVDDFLIRQQEKNCRIPTIVSYCQGLRTFFFYAEAKGLCVGGLPGGIRSPRLSKYRSGHLAPTWTEVRRLLKSVSGQTPLDLRAKAVVLLFVIYGLRNSEVRDLRLSDFDWRKETFGIRRAKRGGTQQYPIQFEVGEAILRYLQHGRPRTFCRHLFVSNRRPFGPLKAGAMWQIIGQRMKRAKIASDHIGPHALRHACASQLLRKGVSMLDIAEFLGHRDTRSVGIYARYDIRLLLGRSPLSVCVVFCETQRVCRTVRRYEA